MSSPALSIGAYGEDAAAASKLASGWLPRPSARGGPGLFRSCHTASRAALPGPKSATGYRGGRGANGRRTHSPRHGSRCSSFELGAYATGRASAGRRLTAEGGPGPGPPVGVSSPGAGTPVPSAAPAALASGSAARLTAPEPQDSGNGDAGLGVLAERVTPQTAQNMARSPAVVALARSAGVDRWASPRRHHRRGSSSSFRGAARAGDRRAAWRAASGGGDRVCRVRHRRNRGRGRGVR